MTFLIKVSIQDMVFMYSGVLWLYATYTVLTWVIILYKHLFNEFRTFYCARLWRVLQRFWNKFCKCLYL